MAAEICLEAAAEEIKMYLCETCRKSQDEICPYFLEHFLEDGCGAVKKCPEYEEEKDDGNS